MKQLSKQPIKPIFTDGNCDYCLTVCVVCLYLRLSLIYINPHSRAGWDSLLVSLNLSIQNVREKRERGSRKEKLVAELSGKIISN